MRARVRNCHILEMLRAQKRPHISFHTPGHKRAGADITELSYSDNLLSPRGVIARAEEDIAGITGAYRAFLLTDGSTSGVHSMLLALREAGIGRVAYPAFCHKSVKDACYLFGLEGREIASSRVPYPRQPSLSAIEEALGGAEALLLTSPDYYGNFPPLKEAAALCRAQNKPLVLDGAHGAHLYGTEFYAGNFARMWVDGAHKSLPALTQGAAVFAADAFWADKLASSVVRCRTTSPSYPILASVEYAYKYPRSEGLVREAEAWKRRLGAEENADWTKLLVPFGSECDRAEAFLERRGIYPEFNDGNFLMFYLSPCTKGRELARLGRLIGKLPRGSIAAAEASQGIPAGRTVWLAPEEAVGRICAQECGLFPPCMPLVCVGERVSEASAARLQTAHSVFGMREGKMLVFEEDA